MLHYLASSKYTNFYCLPSALSTVVQYNVYKQQQQRQQLQQQHENDKDFFFENHLHR